MIQSCTNYFIWTATQGTPSANLQSESQLLDSSKVRSKTQKGLMALNRSIVDLGYSKIPTKLLLTLATVASLVSIVSHLIFYALGSILQILSGLPIAWREPLMNGIRQSFYGSINLIASPGFAILATAGSIALQFRTIAEANASTYEKVATAV